MSILLKKKKRPEINNLKFYLTKLEKSKLNPKQEDTKYQSNNIGGKNETKSCFFEKILKFDTHLTGLTKKQRPTLNQIDQEKERT